MSEESEVTEFEQERMQHPTGHCEDCGCPLDICCKPKKPVRLASESVDLKKLKEECKSSIAEVSKEKQSYARAGYILALNNILDWAEKEAKKNE